jgi:hypothetical protein
MDLVRLAPHQASEPHVPCITHGGGNCADSNQEMANGDRWSREYAMERSRPRDHSSRQRTPLRNADCRRAKSGPVDGACVREDANGPAMVARSTTCYTFIACCTNSARTRSFGQNQSMLPTPNGAADVHVGGGGMTSCFRDFVCPAVRAAARRWASPGQWGHWGQCGQCGHRARRDQMNRGPGRARFPHRRSESASHIGCGRLAAGRKGNTEWLRQRVGVPDTRSLRSCVRVTTSLAVK